MINWIDFVNSEGCEAQLMPNSCKSQNLSAVKPTKFYDSGFKENVPGLNFITVFSIERKYLPPGLGSKKD